MEKRLSIEGMSCHHCVGRVKKTLETFKGVSEARVDLDAKEAIVIYNVETVDTQSMVQEIVKLGFEAKEKE